MHVRPVRPRPPAGARACLLALAVAITLAGCSPGHAGGGDPGAGRTPIRPTPTTARPVKVGTAEPVRDHTYDYQGALLHLRALDSHGRLARTDYDRFICGASLIDPRHALTAAHCILAEKGVSPAETAPDLRLVFGRPTLNGGGGQRRSVTAARVNPRFHEDGPDSVYDVAVLTLNKPVTGIRPVALATAADHLDGTGQVVTFTGWGDAHVRKAGHEDDAQLRERMRAGNVTLMHRSVCQTVYPDVLKRDSAAASILCMKTEQGVGHCLGDSGGPVVAWRGDEPVQVGIISFGAGCGDADYPGAAIRVASPVIARYIAAARRGG